MKPNKFLSFALSLTLSSGLITTPAYAEETKDITAYLSVSKYGDFVEGKNNETMALVPIKLSGEESYTLDDVFVAAHNSYYEGDEGDSKPGYEAGNYLTKFWGDDSGNFGYQVNGGTESVYGVDHPIKDGDCVDVAINKSLYPDNEAYAKFDAYFKKTKPEESVDITLYEAYYDNWNMLFKPCENATITVNGEETELITDEDGMAVLSFTAEGTYTISAVKTKEDSEVTAITAPVCKVSVSEENGETETPSQNPSENPTESATEDVVVPQEITADTMIENIAKKIVKYGISQDDNMQWFAADMAVYSELFPESGNALSDTEKQLCLNTLISTAASEFATTNMYAKDIIALRSLGYDPSNVYTKDNEKLDVLGKLTDRIDENDDSVANIYTLPYVLIALQQMPNEDNTLDSRINALIELAVSEEKEKEWLDTTYGIDGITPMIAALAPYYGTNDSVKALIDKAVKVVEPFIDENGLVTGSASSTGLTIAAYSALGTDVTALGTEKSLIDGLLTQANNTADGFLPEANSYGTEQGFRGLLAWKLVSENKRLYDFKTYPMNVGYTVEVEESEPEATKVPSGGGESDKITVSLKIMVHDADKCNNSYTYKNNSSKYTALASESFTADKGITVYDALIYVLKKNNIEYTIEKSGYVSSINGIGERDHGGNSGWMFTVGGKHVNVGCTESVMNSSGEIVWFFTDDYTKEKGSEHYSSGGGGGSSNRATATPTVAPTEAPTEKATEAPKEDPENETHIFKFSDIKNSAWYAAAVNFVLSNGLFDGITDTEFAPELSMTRGMLVTVLYRFDGKPEVDGELPFTDVPQDSYFRNAVEWAYENGIIDGVTDTEFAPNEVITREQTAAVLYRYAKYKGIDISVGENTNILSYTDFSDISEYAVSALQWLCGMEIINGTTDTELSPKGTATRSQISVILFRFINNVMKG